MTACIVLGLLALLSVFLLTGHGSFLIAGYNTASNEEQEKYDTKKLCRTVGTMLLIITAGIGGLILIPIKSSFATPCFIGFLLLMAADLGIGLYYANTRCIKKEDARFHDIFSSESSPESLSSKKRSLPLLTGILMAILPVIIITSIVLFQASKAPVFILNNDTIQISSAYGKIIYLNDIEKLEMKENLPKNLTKINGSNFGSILKGKFRSNGQNITIFSDASKAPFLYLHTKDGLIILNDQNAQKTTQLYQSLTHKLNESQLAKSRK